MDGVGKLRGRWYSSVSDWYTTGPGLRFTPTPPVLSSQGAELTKQLHWPEVRSEGDYMRLLHSEAFRRTCYSCSPPASISNGDRMDRGESCELQGLHSLSSSSVEE